MQNGRSKNNKKHIAIVGGGSAGWMTAAALSKHLHAEHYHITLVESSQIGTVSVGEATIPGIVEFNQLLGINESEFLRYTKGSFKLGILFKDWDQIGKAYMHPFGPYGIDMQGIPFHHYWLKDLLDNSAQALHNYNFEYSVALQNKFSHPQPNSRSPLANLKYAYHFDATLYADFLRQIAVSQGVNHIQDDIVDVTQHQNDDIETLVLAKHKPISADLFIDCSGFKGLLISQKLKVEFEDWRQYLPCDSAIAQPTESLDDLKPYTVSSAHKNGWQWQIPLQHRIGNGFVFASEFMQIQDAMDTFAKNLPSAEIADPKVLQWVNGKRKQVWKNNCIAIGLSAGFIEPLESTGLHLIQSAITRLLSMFPSFPVKQQVMSQFNDYTNQEIDRIRDFVILHYVANRRDDSSFWRFCQSISLPENLSNKIELYQQSGQVFRDNNELFNEISWFSVLNGQGIVPQSYHPLVNNLPEATRKKHMQTIAGAMRETSNTLMPHKQYLNRYLQSS